MSTESRELPERDSWRPDTEQGLYRKFNVSRTDGSDALGGKHYGCDYFVLDVMHDPLAAAALGAYANAAETTHPQLAADMRKRYNLAHSRAQDSGGEAVQFPKRIHILSPDNSLCLLATYDPPQLGYVTDYPFQLKPRAAEQPAKGECFADALDEDIQEARTPQPSDPSDAVLAQARREFRDSDAAGDVLDWLEERLATPPTAQRHDEDDIGSVIKDLRHSAGVDGYTAQHRSFIHSIANRLAMLSTAHGAGAAVEAVAWQYRFQFTDGAWSGWAQVQSASELEHLLSRYRELKCPAEGRSLFAAPPQQRSEQENDMQEQIDRLANFIMAEIPGEPSQSEGAVDTAIRWMREQVAGGGGVDALPEAKPNDDDPEGFNNGWNCCLSAVRKALSTQPLLSDQPGGVNNESLPEFLERVAQELEERDVGPGSFARGVASSLRGRAYILRSVAAIHPEQAKDGAAG